MGILTDRGISIHSKHYLQIIPNFQFVYSMICK